MFSSVAQSCPTLCHPMSPWVCDPMTPWAMAVARQASLSITNSQSLLKLMSIQSVMLSNHLILCHPLLLPSIIPNIRVFSNESLLCIMWSKYWSLSYVISPSNEYSELIYFRMNWLNLLAVQGTLKSLLQYHTSKASIFLALSFLYILALYYVVIWKTANVTYEPNDLAKISR